MTRKTRKSEQPALFDIEPDWREHWWGMPSFEMGDARPQHKITINFMTAAGSKWSRLRSIEKFCLTFAYGFSKMVIKLLAEHPENESTSQTCAYSSR